MIGLTSSEVYNSVFYITRKNKNFRLYIFLDSEKAENTKRIGDEIEKDKGTSNFTATDSQDEIFGPKVNEK